MESLDEYEVMGECDPMELVHEDEATGIKYYCSVVVHNILIMIGHCVRVALHDGDVGYCQILAIYDDPDPEEGVKVEARWFLSPDELPEEILLACKKRCCFIFRQIKIFFKNYSFFFFSSLPRLELIQER